MDEREYRRNRSGNNNQSPGPITDYERRMRSEGGGYSEDGTNLSIEQLESDDEQLYSRFGSNLESDVIASSEVQVQTPSAGGFEVLAKPVESDAETAQAIEEIGNEALIGALQGDFNDDPTFWSDIGQIVAGLIPVAGQLGDVRDLIHILDDITNKEGFKKIGSWATLVLIVIGFVPGVGDAIKSIGRRGIRYLDNNRILKRIGEWLGENVIAPILNRVGDLTAPLIDQIKNAIRRKLDEAQEIARQVGEGANNVIDDVTGHTKLATEGAGNVNPNRIDNTNQPRQNEPLQSTGTPSGSVPSGRVAQPGGRPDKFKAFKDNTEVPDKYGNDLRFNDLASDPDHGGKVKPATRAEAMAGLEAEAQGLVPGPIKRGPKGTEFYDAMGRPWDVKAPPSPPSGAPWKFNPEKSGGSIKKELSQKAEPKNAPLGTYPNEITGKPEKRRVILDSSYMTKADHSALWKWLNSNLTADELSRIVETNTQL